MRKKSIKLNKGAALLLSLFITSIVSIIGYRLFDLTDRYDGSTPLSFLFLGYREKRWYYEFIIMGKKAFLIIISVFLRSHPRYQIIAASLLVQISFFLHVFFLLRGRVV